MKIQMIKPTAICISEDGSRTERFGIGEQVESKDDWMVVRMKGLVSSGRAMEVGGNAAPTETKKRTVRKKAAS